MALFQRRDLEEYTNSLADYLPGGILFASKSVANSNFRKLLRGMAGELFRSNGLLIEYSEEIIPDKTVKFIAEWENALGIPDDCFPGTGSIDTRRRDVLTKLAALGIQTKQDFIDVGAIFGVTVDVKSGSFKGIFPIEFPMILFSSAKESRFTLIITMTVPSENEFTYKFPFQLGIVQVGTLEDEFPYTFPFQFGSGPIAILECLFSKLKPANCKIIFKQI